MNRHASTVRGFLAPGLFSDVAVLRLVARNEVLKMGIGQRLLLERVMHVGAVGVVPDFRTLGVGAGWTVVEEDHVGLYAGALEDASRQTQDGVQVSGPEELPPDRLSHGSRRWRAVRRRAA